MNIIGRSYLLITSESYWGFEEIHISKKLRTFSEKQYRIELPTIHPFINFCNWKVS